MEAALRSTESFDSGNTNFADAQEHLTGEQQPQYPPRGMALPNHRTVNVIEQSDMHPNAKVSSEAPSVSDQPYVDAPVAAPPVTVTSVSGAPMSTVPMSAAPMPAATIDVPPEAHVKPQPYEVHATHAQHHPSWLQASHKGEHHFPGHGHGHGTRHRRGSASSFKSVQDGLRRSISRVSMLLDETEQAPVHLSRSQLENSEWNFESSRGGMGFTSLAGLHVEDDKEAKRSSGDGGDGAVAEGAEKQADVEANDDEKKLNYIIVRWDGVDDREHNLNMNFYYRCYLTLLAGMLTLATAFASSAPSGIILPMMQEFGTTLMVSKASVFLFVASFCVAPLLWGPLSEVFGRRIIFVVSFLGFVCFNVGCMLAPNIASMIVFRIFSGAFGSSSLSNAPAMIAGLFPIKYLLTGIVVFAIAPTAGPCIGPIVSGYITDSGADWRWLFRAYTIFTFVLFLLVVFTMPETLDPLRLKMKAERLRRETGNERYVAPIELRKVEPAKLAVQSVYKPIKMLFQEPMLMASTLYVAFIYGTLYLLFVAYPVVFMELHNFSFGAEGLTFLGFFVGTVMSAAFCLAVDQRLYLKEAEKKNVVVLRPERRLFTSMIGAPCLVISLFWFAWTSFPSVSYWSPLVAGGMFGFGLFLIFLSLMTYVTEVYLMNAASAMAANMVVRSAFGAGFPMFGSHMYENLNPRWATTVLAFIALAMVPIPFVLYIFGAKIRGWSKNAQNRSH